MNRRIGFVLALAAGVAIGGAAVHTLHAQASPPAYVVTELDVSDSNREAFLKEYAPLVAPTFAPFGGRYLIRGGNSTSFEGEAPKRYVVIAFDSLEKAKAWRESDAYKKIIPLRTKLVASTRSFAIEGVGK